MDFDPVIGRVEGHSDLRSFAADVGFVRDEKSLSENEYEAYKDKMSEGDLLIAGWGANLELDRENEAFTDGAFERGLKSFLEGEATLTFQHKYDHVMGKVLAATQVPGKGVRVVARVDHQPQSSPLRGLYEQVKKGSLNAFSAGGFFRRKLTGGGWRISDVDLTEWAISGVPVGRGCNFAVVAGKALADLDTDQAESVVEVDEPSDEELAEVEARLCGLEDIFTRIGAARSPEADVVPEPVTA